MILIMISFVNHMIPEDDRMIPNRCYPWISKALS